MRNDAIAWRLLLTGLTIAFAGLPLTLRGQTKGETDTGDRTPRKKQ